MSAAESQKRRGSFDPAWRRMVLLSTEAFHKYFFFPSSEMLSLGNLEYVNDVCNPFLTALLFLFTSNKQQHPQKEETDVQSKTLVKFLLRTREF